MVESGHGKYVYNVFTDLKNKPELESINSINKYIKEQITNSSSLSESDLQEGDIVNMYYENSKYTKTAYEKGRGVITTHEGIVKRNANGELVIEHNILLERRTHTYAYTQQNWLWNPTRGIADGNEPG